VVLAVLEKYGLLAVLFTTLVAEAGVVTLSVLAVLVQLAQAAADEVALDSMVLEIKRVRQGLPTLAVVAVVWVLLYRPLVSLAQTAAAEL
jgi:hypothetical protein